MAVLFSSRRRNTRSVCDLGADVCASDLPAHQPARQRGGGGRHCSSRRYAAVSYTHLEVDKRQGEQQEAAASGRRHRPSGHRSSGTASCHACLPPSRRPMIPAATALAVCRAPTDVGTSVRSAPVLYPAIAAPITVARATSASMALRLLDHSGRERCGAPSVSQVRSMPSVSDLSLIHI